MNISQIEKDYLECLEHNKKQHKELEIANKKIEVLTKEGRRLYDVEEETFQENTQLKERVKELENFPNRDQLKEMFSSEHYDNKNGNHIRVDYKKVTGAEELIKFLTKQQLSGS